MARLAPLDDAFAFARVQAFNTYLCATVHVAHAHRLRGYRWADDAAAIAAMKRTVPRSVGECFHLIEHEMLEGPRVVGRGLHDLRSLSLHRVRLAEAVKVYPFRFPQGPGSPPPTWRCARRSWKIMIEEGALR